MMRDRASVADSGDGWREGMRHFAGLLTVAQRLVNADFHRRMDAAGFADVRPGSGNVLGHVGPKGSTIASMARRAGVSQQALVQVVDDLEAKGYVERVPAPGDRRAKLVRQTALGRRMTAAAGRIFSDMEAEYGGLLGADRFEHLWSLLAQLHQQLDDGHGRTP